MVHENKSLISQVFPWIIALLMGAYGLLYAQMATKVDKTEQELRETEKDVLVLETNYKNIISLLVDIRAEIKESKVNG